MSSHSAPPPQPQPPLRGLAGEGGLVAIGLGKRYRKRPVVRGVSIACKRGEAVGLLGPNGAGKTTTFYMITGLVQPDEGRVDHGRPRRHHACRCTAAPASGLGYLPQEASIFRGLSVEDNIRAALEVVEPDRDRREQMLDALLAEFGIAHLRRAPALALSGGERRRCEIARALATHPTYILLDEPLAGIDPIAVGEIRDLVQASEEPRHRRADHRPQRPRDAGDHRPRLYPARRPGADGGAAARHRRA